MLRQRALSEFLQKNTHPDLAYLFSDEMECQVNVAADGGEKTSGTAKSGHKWQGFTDGKETWKGFRIPWAANTTEPTYEDRELNYDARHFDGIGLTGWNWRKKKSCWVGFDFDSVISHKIGLSDDELHKIRRAVEDVPWVTVRKSTSGKGLHLYIFLDPQIPTASHTEHAALARAVLGLLSARVGAQLHSKVDTCGGILWIWHRRMSADGYALVRSGAALSDVPVNWQDHSAVVEGKGPRRCKSPTPGSEEEALDALVSRTKTAPLTDEHKLLMGWLAEHGSYWWWDADRGILVAHTYDLQEAHRELKLKGPFYTAATGKNKGRDQNCFAFPLRGGAWVVRRHTRRTAEHPMWVVDGGGWTRCFLNCPANFITACRCHGAIERPDGRFELPTVRDAMEALRDLGGVQFTLAELLEKRPALLREHKDGRAIVSAKTAPGDTPPEGWARSKDGEWWERLVDIQNEEPELEVPDEFIRHLVTNGLDSGWFIYTRGQWVDEPESNVRKAMVASGISPRSHQLVLGHCVLHPWHLVCRPFQLEYPGNRTWNRNAPQFSCSPEEGEWPTWRSVFDHCGANLTEAIQADGWCKDAGINTGGDYLLMWAAALVQFPSEPLPYLFLHGPQNSGKSTLHEALSLLLKNRVGCVRADVALTSQSRFNAELENAILCVVEEVNLQTHKDAYSRVKDWVTSKTLLMHRKGFTPVEVTNLTHWIQTANEQDACPAFQGDSRIVVIRVSMPDVMIPKIELKQRLEVEMPAFVYAICNMEVPRSPDRLRVPVVTSAEKVEMEEANEDPVSYFFNTQMHPCVGNAIPMQEVYNRFFTDLPAARRGFWTYGRFRAKIPFSVMRGKYSNTSQYHIGNLAFDKSTPAGLVPLVRVYDKLVEGGEYLATR